jgi:hypothetical protein
MMTKKSPLEFNRFSKSVANLLAHGEAYATILRSIPSFLSLLPLLLLCCWLSVHSNNLQTPFFLGLGLALALVCWPLLGQAKAPKAVKAAPHPQVCQAMRLKLLALDTLPWYKHWPLLPYGEVLSWRYRRCLEASTPLQQQYLERIPAPYPTPVPQWEPEA